MYFLYLIICESGSIYTGVTDSPERRFLEHKSGKGGRYTKINKPINLFYKEEFKTKKDALLREKQIKGWRRDKKINLAKFGYPTKKLS
jgi:putative endonuclease